jgi:hypothetical protein
MSSTTVSNVILAATLDGPDGQPEYIALGKAAAVELKFVHDATRLGSKTQIVRWVCEDPDTFFGANDPEEFHRFILLAEHAAYCGQWLESRENIVEIQRDLVMSCQQLCSDFGVEEEADAILDLVLDEATDFSALEETPIVAVLYARVLSNPDLFDPS